MMADIDIVESWQTVRDYLIGKLQTVPEIAARIEGTEIQGAYEINPVDPEQCSKKDWVGFVHLDKSRMLKQTLGTTVRFEVMVQVGIIVATTDPAKRDSALTTAKLRLANLVQSLAHTDGNLGDTSRGFKIIADDGVGTSRDKAVQYAFVIAYLLVKLKGEESEGVV